MEDCTDIFLNYFSAYCTPTAETLFLPVLSMPAMESADSIRSLYRHFLSGITEKSLNAFYYACSCAKADYSRFMNVTAGMALKLIPESLCLQPVFLCIDDTMVSKFGQKFETVSKLFDHATYNGSNYLNGHCFVSLMLCVPVWEGNRIHDLSVPLGYRIWQKKESRLELAASMVRRVMPEFFGKKNVNILCDIWYVKKPLVSIIDEYENPDLVGNARSDSVMYGLPQQRTGKRLSIRDDFTLSDEKTGGCHTGFRRVLTALLGKREVLAYVTSPDRDSGSRRLFFSTVFPEQLQIFCAWQDRAPLNQTGSDRMQLIPLLLYAYRWNIEVSYYEQKTFWSLCSYMVRSRKGIEMLINLAYCAMKLLPYHDEAFAGCRTESVQEFRSALSTRIREQIFYAIFVENIQTRIKSNAIIRALKQLIRQQGYHW